MKPRLLLPVVLIASALASSSRCIPAQTNHASGTLSGVVIVRDEGVPIGGVHVWVHEANDKASFMTQSDSSGAFSIQLPDGYYFVCIGKLALAPFCKTIWIYHGKPVKLDVRLGPDRDTLQDTNPGP